jgi:hypothetical protein
VATASQVVAKLDVSASAGVLAVPSAAGEGPLATEEGPEATFTASVGVVSADVVTNTLVIAS